MTVPFPDARHGARRELHRDQPGREGIEAELVSRLTEGLGSEGTRRSLARCLDGELSGRAALMQLLLAGTSVTALRELVDEITARADADSRAGDSLVRDRADALTRWFVENEAACARVAARLERSADVRELLDAQSPAADEDTYYERLFDQLVGEPT